MRPILALALLAIAAAGCSLKPPRVGDRAPEDLDARREANYQSVLDRYTAQSEIYAGLDTRILAAATYQSWPFRQARVQRRAAFQAQTDVWTQAELGKERASANQWHEFFFGVHANDSH